MAVTQPAANLWDIDDVTMGALAVLRLENDDIDETTVTGLAAEATQLIDVELDKVPVTEPTAPFNAGAVPTLFRAAVKLTAHLYLNPPPVDIGTPDAVDVVRAEVRPWRARWGIA